MSVADQIKEQLEHGKMPTPISPKVVRLKRIIIWIAVSAVTLLGVLSTAIAVWFLTDPQGLLFEWQRNSWWHGIVIILPFFWVLLSVMAGITAFWIFTQTSQGYRYRVSLVAIAVTVSFMAFGGSLYAAGIADRMEAAAYRFMPGYARIVEPQINKYQRPNEGRIFGEMRQLGPGAVEITDPNGRVWEVKVETAKKIDPLPAERAEGCACTSGLVTTTGKVLTVKTIRPCPRLLKNKAEMLKRKALNAAVKEMERQERTRK